MEAERQVCENQSQMERDKLGPRDGILYQTLSRLPVANQIFLGSWMVDICQESHSLEIGSSGQTYSTPEKLLSGN